jgi:hypothetical protein
VAAGVGFVLFLLVLATRRYRLVPALYAAIGGAIVLGVMAWSDGAHYEFKVSLAAFGAALATGSIEREELRRSPERHGPEASEPQ